MSDYRLDIEVSSEKALKTIEELTKRLERLNNAGNNASSNVGKTGSVATSAARGFNLLSQSTSNAGEGMLRLSKTSGDLNGSLLLLTKSLLSYEIAARAISASDDYIGMSNRLKLVTDSQEELQKSLDDTFAIAQKTGTVWSSTVQIYQRFMDVSDRLGKSQEEIGRITETVSKAIAMSGATAESANAAIIQFSQGIASGVLRGQEFNSVAEQTPALLDAIARGLNKDRSELRAMANQGQLTADVVVGALEKAGESTDELFSRVTLGVSATFNKLRNAATQWIGEMNTASGATSVLTSAMNMLAENLDGAVFLAGTAALTYLTKTIVASTTSTMQDIAAKQAARAATIAQIQATAEATAVTAAHTTAKIAAATASVNEARANLAVATTSKEIAIAKAVLTARETQLAAATAAGTAATAANTAATNALAASTSRLAVAKSAALGLFGGGAGLIALGVSAAAMYLLMRKNTDESAEAAERHAKYIDLDRIAIEKLNSAQRENAIDVLTESLNAQNKELELAQSQYAGLVNQLSNLLRKAGSSKELQEVNKLLQDVRTGVVSLEEATDILNKKELLSKEHRQQLLDAEKRYNDVYKRASEAHGALEKFGKESKIAGNEAQNAALRNNQLNNSLEATKTKAEEASAAMKKYNDALLDSVKENSYTVTRFKNGGVSLDQAEAEAKYYAQTGKAPDAQVIKDIRLRLALEKEVAAIKDSQKQSSKTTSKQETEAERERNRLIKEAEREREARLKNYQSFLDSTRSETESLAAEFQAMVTLWEEFGGGDMVELGKIESAFQEKVAEAQIADRDYKDQFSDYWNTEADNLNAYYERQEYLLRYSTKVTQEERAKMREDLMKAWANEIDLIAIKWDLERLEAKKAFMDEKAYLEELNRLRLEQIKYTPDLTQDQKNIRSDAQNSDYQNQVNAIDQKAWNDYVGVIGNLGTSPQDQLMNQLLEQREIVLEAQRQGIIDKETYIEALEMLDAEYMHTSAQMRASMFGDSLNGWTTFFKNVEGENSTAYKTLFMMQKAFSMASAAVNISKAISDGWASGADIGTKLSAVATIIAQTGNILADISSVTMSGFKSGGYTGSVGRNTIAGFVHGNEFVMPAEETAKYRNELNAMHRGDYQKESNGSGGNTFNFNNYFTLGEGGQVSASTEKQDAEFMGNALNIAMRDFLLEQMMQGGLIDNWARRKGI